MHADQYFRGLLRPGRHKTITGLATRMNAHQERLERFVRESPWVYAAVETHLRQAASEAFQGDAAALIVDGMGIPKKGNHSVGVYQQWCGATGKLDNCQVTVNCTLARPGDDLNADTVSWPLSMRLYLPKKWICEDDSVYDDQAEREDYARRGGRLKYQMKSGITRNTGLQSTKSRRRSKPASSTPERSLIPTTGCARSFLNSFDA